MKPVRKSGFWAGVLVLSLWFLAGCVGNKPLYEPHRVENQPDAGTVNLAVTLVAPWEDYIVALSPNFTLEPDDAVNKVIPQTTIQEDKILDSLAASLQLGFPQSFIASKTTTLTGADTGAKGLRSVPEGTRKVSKDPMLEYNVATALYQEVKLLNRYISDAALKRDFRPYVVRLQINIVPFARNQPYDVYTTLGFFATYEKDKDKTDKDKKDKDKTVNAKAYVVPLLVTDNMEGTLKSRTVDTIRQFALALSILQGGVGGQAGLSKRNEELQSVLGTDINSLLTVGRITDNTIQVRLGASRQATAAYAMLPRTHNITLVVMVPKDLVNKRKPQVRVVSNTVMRDVETGKALQQQSRNDRLDNIKHVLERYLDSDIPEFQADKALCKLWGISTGKCLPDTLKNKAKEEFPKEDITDFKADKLLLCKKWKSKEKNCPANLTRKAIDELLYKVFANDYKGFVNILEATDWNRGFERDLWMEIAKSLGSSEFSGARFDLPIYIRPELPDPKQDVLLVDDMEKQMRVSLIGGHGLSAERMSAKLTLPLQDSTEASLAATSISVGARGGDPVLVFPSAAAWNIGPLKLDKAKKVKNARLVLTHESGDRWNTDTGPKPTDGDFLNIRYRQKVEAPKPAFAIRSTVGLIKAEKGGGKVKVHVEFVKDSKKQPLAKKIEITVDGAEIVNVTLDSKEKLSSKLGKVTVTKDGTVEFELRNLDNTKKVTLKLTALDENKKPIGGKHKDITFEVKSE